MSLKMLKIASAVMATTLGGMALASVAPASASDRVVVEKNHNLRVALSAPAGSVIVGNPDIADVNVVDSRTIYILGKSIGRSEVTVTDQMGRTLFDGEVAVTAGEHGAITVYKGLKPTLMICSNVCIAEDAGPSNASPTPAGASPLPAAVMNLAPAVGQGAASVGSTVGAATQ